MDRGQERVENRMKVFVVNGRKLDQPHTLMDGHPGRDGPFPTVDRDIEAAADKPLPTSSTKVS